MADCREPSGLVSYRTGKIIFRGSSVGRASVSEAEGRGFEPLPLNQFIFPYSSVGRAPEYESGGRVFDSHYGNCGRISAVDYLSVQQEGVGSIPTGHPN